MLKEHSHAPTRKQIKQISQKDKQVISVSFVMESGNQHYDNSLSSKKTSSKTLTLWH